MNSFIKILSITTVAACAGFYASKHFDTSQHHQALSYEPDIDVHQLQKTIKRLQQENTRLQHQLRQEKTSSNPTTLNELSSQALSSAALNEVALQKLEQLEERDLMHTAEKFNDWIVDQHRINTAFNLNDEMQRRFEAEEKDLSWADAKEQEFISLFSEANELSGFALKEAECKTNQCAITVGITDLEQADQVIEQVNHLLQTKDKHAFIIATPNQQKGVTKLYVGKDEHSFEFN